MFRRRFLSFPLVIGAVIIGVVSGKAIFAQPLDEYWKKKLQEKPAAKENDELIMYRDRLKIKKLSGAIIYLYIKKKLIFIGCIGS
ncbi:uncharacterized protein LOC107858332 [Capsicum annuum]|uniref:uncharacterized protein LOC107858332 n=1 Tax=Capsicum annuum TaxID=4072 RepID=UPI001FB0C5B4|nr:uncharacterized protein LOC107858332 [Capsicum annuum]